MTKHVVHKVVLQYGAEGESLTNSTEYEHTVSKHNQFMFIDLDQPSGGYPYPTDIEHAYNFKTVEKAIQYSFGVPGMHVRQLTVTYEVD